jgi:nucleoside 2-deoxyribosyltransferase
MITSVYVAAPYVKRADAQRVMADLLRAGFDVTSSWLIGDDELSDAFARQDLADVDRADALVALNPKEWEYLGSGGRHVEFGYALAKGKRVVLVGARTNIFHHLSHVPVIAETELVDTLRRLV